MKTIFINDCLCFPTLAVLVHNASLPAAACSGAQLAFTFYSSSHMLTAQSRSMIFWPCDGYHCHIRFIKHSSSAHRVLSGRALGCSQAAQRAERANLQVNQTPNAAHELKCEMCSQQEYNVLKKLYEVLLFVYFEAYHLNSMSLRAGCQWAGTEVSLNASLRRGVKIVSAHSCSSHDSDVTLANNTGEKSMRLCRHISPVCWNGLCFLCKSRFEV